MNLNQILTKNQLTEEEYIFLKSQAYQLAANLTGKEIIEYIKNLNSKNIPETEASYIYLFTLTFPNDLDFINEYTSENEHRHSYTYLAQKLNMPSEAAFCKTREIQNLGMQKMLENNVELRKLAEQKPHFKAR